MIIAPISFTSTAMILYGKLRGLEGGTRGCFCCDLDLEGGGDSEGGEMRKQVGRLERETRRGGGDSERGRLGRGSLGTEGDLERGKLGRGESEGGRLGRGGTRKWKNSLGGKLSMVETQAKGDGWGRLGRGRRRRGKN